MDKVRANANRETQEAEAQRRRTLEGNTLFCNLGEPIQKLLMQVHKDLSNDDLKLLSRITVRQLAKVFDMLSLGEDPDKILFWLQREALRAAGKEDTLKSGRKKKIETGAARDAVAFYKELEKKNMELMAKFKEQQVDREKQRKANIEERRKRREEAAAKAAQEKEHAAATGEKVSAVDRLKKTDLADIYGAFDRFTTKSLFDNSNSNQDSEWWKQDDYRRDWERNSRKGKLWTRVVEGGSQTAPDSEMALREEWYRSQCWWKADKYRKDWLASRDAEWWKEESYIRDWQENGEKGRMWLAADEISGFNRKGHLRPAAKIELERRQEWYRDNGPKGIVKQWCALSEGSADRCLLDEKREREDYYKNGDWWKSESLRRKLANDPNATENIKCSGAAFQDREWWKSEPYRQDFNAKGNRWKATTEKSAILGDGTECTQTEQERRAAWYADYWWKAAKYIADFHKNGADGKLWKARSEEDAAQPSPKPCKDVEAKGREEWYLSCEDREWWQDEQFVRDWEENGAKGKKWTAAWQEAALAAAGDKDRASPESLAEREEYYKNSWWKQEKYVKDFQANGKKGAAWKAASQKIGADSEWWKQGEYLNQWGATKRASLQPFWKGAEYVADYWANGADGKKWTAANAAAGSVGKGDVSPATAEELSEREAFYNANWWRTEECRRDYAVNGTSGHLWTAAEPGGKGRVSSAELKVREAYFNPKWTEKSTPAHLAMFEADATPKLTGEFASPEEIHHREETFKKDWWKTPEVREDYTAHGDQSKLLRAATPEVAALGLSGPEYEAPADEIAARKAYFDSAAPEEEWWQEEAFAKEYASKRECEFWKEPECVEDFLSNGANGTKWCASNAAAASLGLGDKQKAPAQELHDREEWLKKNFWRAPAYRADFEQNGDNGALWTTTEPDGKGASASPAEIKHRQAFYKPNSQWQLAQCPDAKAVKCTPVEELDREEWFQKNWWKTPEIEADFAKHGRASDLLKAASPDVVALGLASDPAYQATPEQVEERAHYFETNADHSWWKSPAVVEDFVKYGKEGAVWQSRSLKESQMSMGLQDPANDEELREREEWFEKNFWKTPSAIEDYMKNGNKGTAWTVAKKGAPATERAPDAEVHMREQWMEVHKFVPDKEVMIRKEWMQQQLSDEEKLMRRQWLVKRGEESKRIHTDELADALAALNDGQKPSPEQLKEIEEVVHRRRLEAMGVEHDPDSITQEEFVTAVADTNFYVPATDEERERAEQEALEALQQEEMARLEEEAAFLAMEAEEERAKAGDEAVPAEGEVNDEEAEFLNKLEEEDHQKEAEHKNEDDVPMTAEEQTAYQDWLSKKVAPGEELSEEEAAKLAAQDEERKAAEAADPAHAPWESEDIENEDAKPATVDNKDELEQLVQDDGEHWNNDEDEVEQPEEEPVDEMGQEEKGQPVQWKLPLPEVTNPQYLKSYFTVLKYTPSHSLFGGKQKRVWVVDHFTRCFYNLDQSGKIMKEHAANKLLQLERNAVDTTRLRLMFFDASHSYELQFFSPQERERFYETASAIRPSIRVYAPDLTNPDTSVEACTTTIDGVGPNAVNVTCNNAAGKPANRELTGECKINASKLLTEPLTIWCGTFNLSGHPPPKDEKELSHWMPPDKYDIYAVAVQEASYRRDEAEWFEAVQHHLGKEYLVLASMNLWDTLLIVLTRKKHLLKITNVEGSTKATVHKAVCGTKGGIGISMRYLETSLCFVTCHLAARLERNAMRNTNLEEIFDCLQLGIRETDICNQFNHVFMFGDFNYRLEMEAADAEKMIGEKRYPELLDFDQMTTQRRDEGILHGFQEPPITFAPTYRMQIGSDKYMAERGNAPSYCARVLTRSMANTWVKCTSYKSVPSIQTSEHTPVSATFIVRAVRPTLSCFMKQQSPIPLFVFEEISFTESTGPIIKKPMLTIIAPFMPSHAPIECKVQQTSTPSWGLKDLPRLEAYTHSQEYLETCHIMLIIREGAEKREDKSHRGTGLITMFGRVVGLQDTQQEFESDIMSHGKCIGKLLGKFHWEPAVLKE